MKRIVSALVLGVGFATSAQATYVGQLQNAGVQIAPAIEAGAPPDSPSARVDPNVSSSAFTGVVSINIRFNGLSFICSGTAITPYDVLSAGHCIDLTDTGTPIDLSVPGNDVRVVVNDDGTFNPTTDLITASKVTLNPDYQGFGVCPFQADFQCLNDDISIIHLSQALPSTVQIYGIYDQPVAPGSVLTMVGYGTSGDGLNGYTVAPSFFIKRSGANVFDVFDTNDEQNFDPNSPAEVWYNDFDGVKDGVSRDTWCTFAGVCGTSLGNGIETLIGGGDSGGPAFIQTANGLMLAANNTFTGNVFFGADQTDGDFGDIGGGILLYPYLDWIRETIPEPNSLALFAVGLLAVATIGRRRVRLNN